MTTQYLVPQQAIDVQNVVLRNATFCRWAVTSPVAEIVASVIQSQSVRFYFDNFFCAAGRHVPRPQRALR